MTETIKKAEYGGHELPARVFSTRYAITPDETYKEACVRVVLEVVRAEEPEYRDFWFEKFYDLLATRLFMPGGRIWHGAGRPHPQLLNCFVVPIDDSLPAWMDALSETCRISGLYGGVGLNFSRVRAEGSASASGPTGGPLMPMRMINYCIGELEQTGGRRGALMFALDHDHPDIMKFLELKAQDGAIRNANISVNFRKESLRNYLRDSPDSPLWSGIFSGATTHGEPGILNGHLANEENNIWYAKELICTNPCGEIWLEPYGCCCLGHINLVEHVDDDDWDYDAIADTVRTGVRFLDDVLSVNQYPLPAIADNCQAVRRIGLGVTGLHHALILQGRSYNDFEAIESLFRTVRNVAYGASIDLASEKGPFQRFDTRMLSSGFCQRLPDSLRKRIESEGIRNCALLTVAPTGTISTVLDVSPGIEPLMGRAYTRIWRDGEEWTSVECEDPVWLSLEGDPNARLCQEATEIPLDTHLGVQALIQRFVDNSVSKTINVPAGLDPLETARIIGNYAPLLKGVTLYPAASREGSPIASHECSSGTCDV